MCDLQQARPGGPHTALTAVIQRLTFLATCFMIELKNLDLRSDAAAQRVVKDETVSVEFAAGDGELMSLEGPNRYVRGDALITGSTGDRWVVSRDRFDAKYLPAEASLAHGEPGAYRNRPAVVLARQMTGPFTLARSAAGGDVLRGTAGDWVMQYAPGDYGVVQAARFAKVYRLAE
ncbi:hypothetical protein P3T17_000794 [Paraburkholderia sp. GAS82]|jgi:PGDYG protein